MPNEILKVKKKRYKYSVVREKNQLAKLISELPTDEEYKIVSEGGFSSIGFLFLVMDKTKINDLTASTLRVGKKHLKSLDIARKNGKLGNATFVVGGLMKNDSQAVKKYNYYDDLLSVCEKNNWEVIVTNNHSKILLIDTDLGKFVIETSSNLNENPKKEQFNFYQSDEAYKFYQKFLLERGD
ncbi:hypothetical protein VD175_001994 [Enterococcus faecium]|nr:hypothetical protein [Enterococcus faecium]